MGIQRKLLVGAILLLVGALAGPGSPDAAPARSAAAAHRFPIQIDVATLGVSWTGAVTIDDLGAVHVFPEPGLRWQKPRPTGAGEGLLVAARRCLRFVGSLLDLPAPLASAARSLLAGPGR